MFKIQPKSDVAEAVDHIVLNNQTKFQKFKAFKNIQNKRFNNIVTVSVCFLFVNMGLMAFKLPSYYIEAVMYTEIILFVWSLYKLKTPYPEYADVADMFSNQSIKNTFKELNIKNNGYLIPFNVDEVVVDRYLSD